MSPRLGSNRKYLLYYTKSIHLLDKKHILRKESWYSIYFKPKYQKRSSQNLLSLFGHVSNPSGIGSFNFNSSLFLRQWVYESSRGEQWHTDESSVVIPSEHGPDLFHPSRVSLSSLIGRLKQVPDRTGVGSLTLPWLERNWLAYVWVCAAKRTLCKTIQGSSILNLIIVPDKRVRLGIPEVWKVC